MNTKEMMKMQFEEIRNTIIEMAQIYHNESIGLYLTRSYEEDGDGEDNDF